MTVQDVTAFPGVGSSDLSASTVFRINDFGRSRTIRNGNLPRRHVRAKPSSPLSRMPISAASAMPATSFGPPPCRPERRVSGSRVRQSAFPARRRPDIRGLGISLEPRRHDIGLGSVCPGSRVPWEPYAGERSFLLVPDGHVDIPRRTSALVASSYRRHQRRRRPDRSGRTGRSHRSWRRAILAVSSRPCLRRCARSSLARSGRPGWKVPPASSLHPSAHGRCLPAFISSGVPEGAAPDSGASKLIRCAGSERILL